MTKCVTLRIDEEVYKIFKTIAEQEKRPLSNFIETAALRYIKEFEFVDEFEMAEINNNTDLKDSMKRGIEDYEKSRGQFN